MPVCQPPPATDPTLWQTITLTLTLSPAGGEGTEAAVSGAVTLIELTLSLSVIFGGITGAAAGARHGLLGFALGGAAGLVIGFISYVATASPMVLMMSRGESHGIRAKLDNFLGGLWFSVLAPLSPIGAGIASWWLVRRISG